MPWTVAARAAPSSSRRPGPARRPSCRWCSPGCVGDGPARRVVVAEPRRIAARAAARRMAWLLGEKVGESVGYTVRGERVVGRTRARGGRHDRCAAATAAAGPGAGGRRRGRARRVPRAASGRRHGGGVPVDVREALRPELRLVAASATTDAAGVGAAAGRGAGGRGRGSLVSGRGGVGAARAPGAAAARHAGGPGAADACGVGGAAGAARARAGTCCASCPGSGRSRAWPGSWASSVTWRCSRCTGGRRPPCRTRCCRAGARRRVVLATSVAESSLTVPGVRVVVDSGLAREPRVDHARGLSALTTVRASQAAGRQRAGRAGREAPGAVYRCWTEAEDARLPRFPAPEIKVADLTAFALQAACWGDPDASGLALLDAPPAGAMAAARSVLTAIGAVEAPSGRATERGVRLRRLGLHPRLARALLDAAPLVGARPRRRGGRPAERGAAAGVRRRSGRPRGAPRAGAPTRTPRAGGRRYGGCGRRQAARTAASRRATPVHDAGPAGRVSGGPGRRARRRARLSRAGGAWARRRLVPDGVRDAGRARGRVTAAGRALDRRRRRRPARRRRARARAARRGRRRGGRAAGRRRRCTPRATRCTGPTGTSWRGGSSGSARWSWRCGRCRNADPGLVREALLEGLRRGGVRPAAVVPGGRGAAAAARVSAAARSARPGPTCRTTRCTRAWTSGWSRSSAGRGGGPIWRGSTPGRRCGRLLPWATGDAARLDELAPERIEVPSGSRIRIDYANPEQPVLAVKLQEMFGLHESPARGRGAGPRASAVARGAARGRDRRPGLLLAGRLPGAYGPSCAAGTRSIRGPRTRRPPSRPGTRTRGSGADRFRLRASGAASGSPGRRLRASR